MPCDTPSRAVRATSTEPKHGAEFPMDETRKLSVPVALMNHGPHRGCEGHHMGQSTSEFAVAKPFRALKVQFT